METMYPNQILNEKKTNRRRNQPKPMDIINMQIFLTIQSFNTVLSEVINMLGEA
jgi:hypothetical protein